MDDILMEIAHIVMGFHNEDSRTHYRMLCEIEDLIANSGETDVPEHSANSYERNIK